MDGMSFFDVAVAVGVAFIMGVNVALCVAVLRQRAIAPALATAQEAPRTVEIVVKSVFMDEGMQEERLLVDALSDEPVELTLVLDEQAKEYR